MSLSSLNIKTNKVLLTIAALLSGFITKAQVTFDNLADQTKFYENNWVIISLCVVVVVFIYFFFKNFTRLRLQNFESYTTHNEIITKIRVLSALSFTLLPLVEYYEGVYLKMYEPNWYAISIVNLLGIFSVIISFRKNTPLSFLILLPQISYYIIYSLLAYRSIKAGMLPVMAIETACIILFSKLVFNKLKTLLYFFMFVVAANIFLLNVYNINADNLNVYVSASIQTSIVAAALFLLEGSANRKIGFGNKVLESSNLFILVADKNADFVFVNSHLEDVTGLKQHEILKDGWWHYLGYEKETTDGLRKLITDSIKEGKNSTYESTIKDKDSNLIYVNWDNTVIEEQYLLAVGKNVTQAKLLQIEESLRKEKVTKYNRLVNSLTTVPYSESDNLKEVLESIVKNIAEAIDIERTSVWKLNVDKLVCETQYLRTNGVFESGEILNRKDFPKYFAAIEQARVVDAPDVYNHHETTEFIKEYFTLNRIKSLLDVPIFINGELIGVICCEQIDQVKVWDNEDINFARTVADLVALSIEAAKRKDLEREYSHILNNAGDIIYTTDSLGNFDFINKTASHLLGYDTRALKGKHFTTIIHPDFVEKTGIFYLRQFKKKTETSYLEFKVLNANGEGYWVGQSVKLVLERDNPEKVKGFQAVVRDINNQKKIEQALLESENNFRQLNENINEAFYLYNFEKAKYDYMSPNCKSILGTGQNFFYEGKDYVKEFVLDEDKKPVSEYNKDGQYEEAMEVEFRILVDGKLRWIREKSFAIKNEKGKIIKRSGTCTDVTEKKQQEERLKQLSLVAQNVSNGVIITNPYGLIEWCNESVSKMLEYELEEIIGKRPIEVFSGPETPFNTKQEVIRTKLEKSSIELPQYTKSGKLKWLFVTNTAVLNDKGQVDKYIEIVTDITDRKLLENQYRYILDNAGDVIYTTNAEGIVEFLNESITKILGYQPEEIIGKHFTYIIHPEDKKRVAIFYLKQFAQKKESTYYEFRVLNKEGLESWVGQNVKLAIDPLYPSNVKGFQSILRNITKQKEAEHALIESENNFRQINEAIADVFYLYNIKENKYEYISPNAIDVLGVDAVYFYYVNNFAKDYILEKDYASARAAFSKIRQGEPFEVEYRIRVDQEIRWIKEKGYVVRDANLEVIKSSGTCIDITQKKIQEKSLLKINKELSTYSEDLAINNLLKEQLIYTNDFEEIAKVSLSTLKVKIAGIARGSLFLTNESTNVFDVFYVDKEEMSKDIYEFGVIKAYPFLLQGKKFIEHNIDLSKNLSISDIQRRKENIISYIMLPINYSNTLIGALALEFETPFSLSKREMDILENFTSVLSVVVNKLTLQKELATKSKDVIASLNYAKSIQRSILPNISNHQDVIKNFMCFYIPKDVVSGDFYMVENFDEYTLIALGDCTGHGVPGAFITLLGSNFLQRIAIENKTTSPAQILEQLDTQLFTYLNKNSESTVRDGMELGLCLHNKKNKTLTFAGAGLFLVYYKDNQQFIVQGDKRSIGDENYVEINFMETEIDLNGTEKFFMFSDGYRDQLGGLEKRKRFSRARFLDLLNTIKNLPPFQQEYILKMEHDKHRGKLNQTDDISVLGFEFK